MSGSSIYIIVPILVFFKILIWAAICYRRSERYRAQQHGGRIIVAHPTTIIHRTIHHGQNEIQGVENPGYMQPPPAYSSVVGEQTFHSQSLPTYEDVVKSTNCHQTVNTPS